MNNENCVDWALTNYVPEHVAIAEYSKQIIDAINLSDIKVQPLPPVNFSISINDNLELSLEDGQSKIIDATKRYTNLYIVKKESEIERVNSFHSVINRKDSEIKALKNSIQETKKINSELNNKLIKAKAKQKNITWVAILGIIVLVFGFVLWNKVLFPSEVTHYETGEFVYYGPLEDGKPNGVGVAIYPANDKDGRKYYIGNFKKGERQDSAAVLFYQDGDYYYGSMEGDQWGQGMLYMNSDNSHFVGTFLNNNPYTGKWYDHMDSQKSYCLYEGKNASGIKPFPHKTNNKTSSEDTFGSRRKERNLMY